MSELEKIAAELELFYDPTYSRTMHNIHLLVADWRKRGDRIAELERKLADIRSLSAYLPVNTFTF